MAGTKLHRTRMQAQPRIYPADEPNSGFIDGGRKITVVSRIVHINAPRFSTAQVLIDVEHAHTKSGDGRVIARIDRGDLVDLLRNLRCPTNTDDPQLSKEANDRRIMTHWEVGQAWHLTGLSAVK